MDDNNKVAPNINLYDTYTLEQARHADLVSYLQLLGIPLKKEGRSYRVSGYGGLIVTDYRWYWHSRQKGGKAIDFLMEFFGMTFQEAVQQLIGENHFLLEKKEEALAVPDGLPERASNEKRVLAYLSKTRGIEYSIIVKLIQSGKLYQDINGNCVFLIFDRSGHAVGAEIHGTVSDKRYKRSIRYDGFGFTLSSGVVRTVAYFESAIDLLSFYQIYRNKISNYLLVSMGGLSPSVILNYHGFYPNTGCDHILFVDHDQAGHDFAVYSQLPVKYPAVGKDWNEYLLSKYA